MAETLNAKIIRIQGDRLCNMLDLPTGTKIPLETIKRIAISKVGDHVTVEGKDIVITHSIIALGNILTDKITGGK